MDTYLTYLDQLRYMAGILCILLLLCHGILPSRPRYPLRMILSWIGALSAALVYIPLQRHFSATEGVFLPVSVVYWIVIALLPLLIIHFCYNATWAGTIFRAILCVSAENFITGLIYYLFVKCLFPDFPSAHPAVYSLFLLLCYLLFLSLGWHLLRTRVSSDENSLYHTPGRTALTYLWAYLSFLLLISLDKLCFEWTILPLSETADYEGIYWFLSYFLTLNLLLLSTVISFIMLIAYQTQTLQNEKQIVMQMVKDRQSQYEFSRENIEMINRKAHDLKHQLLALERIPDKDRRTKLLETSRSIDFYDAVVKTGNEALDTILTEKNVYCLNRGIRLSSTVRSRLLERIDVVDLYTLLGNAMDNAIEAADRLSSPEKKTISLTIQDREQMLYIQLENYYEGDLQISDGLPLTTKQDDLNHGYGTKSIRAITRRYGGTVMIHVEEGVFSLEILIPM